MILSKQQEGQVDITSKMSKNPEQADKKRIRMRKAEDSALRSVFCAVSILTAPDCELLKLPRLALLCAVTLRLKA